jgi:hypothetical protein
LWVEQLTGSVIEWVGVPRRQFNKAP